MAIGPAALVVPFIEGLLDEREIDLRPALRPAKRHALRAGADLEAVKGLLAQAIESKPKCHYLHEAVAPRDRTMAQIGG